MGAAPRILNRDMFFFFSTTQQYVAGGCAGVISPQEGTEGESDSAAVGRYANHQGLSVSSQFLMSHLCRSRCAPSNLDELCPLFD